MTPTPAPSSSTRFAAPRRARAALALCFLTTLLGCLPSSFDPIPNRRDGGTDQTDDPITEPGLDAGTSTAIDAGDASIPSPGDGGSVDARVPPEASCAAPRQLCGDLCTDTRSDPQHCDGCGQVCPLNTRCSTGRCVSDTGCADGTREAFSDRTRFPRIAACAATWPRRSLRAPPTGRSCGNTPRSACLVPADACAIGWHLCGIDGPEELRTQITQEECGMQRGRWAISLSDFGCRDCGVGAGNGAVCCGDRCVQQNGTCLWPGATAWFGLLNSHINACGEIENEDGDGLVGVVCCRGPDVTVRTDLSNAVRDDARGAFEPAAPHSHR